MCYLNSLLNRTRKAGVFVALVLSPALLCSGAAGQEESPRVSKSHTAATSHQGSNRSEIGDLEVHDHSPVFIRSRPVIERLPVHVVDPADLCITVEGIVYIADRRAGVVIRLQPDGVADLIVGNLPDISRILIDTDGRLYVLTATAGSGRVSCILPSGLISEVCRVDFAPVGFARDETGAMIISSASGRTILVDASGDQTELATVSESIHDLVLTASDQIHVLLASGRVVYLGRDGSSSTAGFAPHMATRLFASPDGKLAALHQAADNRKMVTLVADRGGQPVSKPFAQVPSGTVAVAFDALGNMCMANPDLRAITKVSSRFSVPCPHCSRPLTLVLTTDPPAESEGSTARPSGKSF